MKKMLPMSLMIALISLLVACGKTNHPYEQEYVVGQGNIKGNVDTTYFYERDERFEIGATKDGYAVFKNPDAAFHALLEKYSNGLSLIQEEENLQPISQTNYEDYKTYGWQVTTGSEEAQEQAQFVSSFLDIYENSFSH